MSNKNKPLGKYEQAFEDRQRHVQEVLTSNSKKKIVVAGPGTGKTYLFGEVLKDKNQSLTLTFINTLVEDLSLELCGVSDVKTLHSFARSELGRHTRDVKIFPKLVKVIEEDALVLLKKTIDFNKIFHNRDDENKRLEFYKMRKDYYDSYYGYSDIIFAIVKYLEANNHRIPKYDQILVDEYQDFNRLEVSLIELLSGKSPILLAGDDDQALYDWKDASTDYIRSKYSDKEPEYEIFSLPYCSRCTEVIVEAINDVITAAHKQGYLEGRISKDFKYFPSRGKDKESSQNPKLIYSQCYDRQVPWLIQKQLNEIAKVERGKFSVLIISPTNAKVHSIGKAFKKKGYEKISFADKQEKEPTLMDGFKILIQNNRSNLGWRIVSKFFLSDDDFQFLLRKTNKKGAPRIVEIIDEKLKKRIAEIIKVLKTIKKEQDVDESDLKKVLQVIGINPYKLSKHTLKNKLLLGSQRLGNAALRKIPIKLVTIQSSKGLSAEYVFITHFDDTYFIRNKNKSQISDQDICNFIVALTRARKKVFLISCDRGSENKPTFLKWIKKERVEIVS